MSETDHAGRLAVGILGLVALFVVGFIVALAPRFVGLSLGAVLVFFVGSYLFGWFLDVLGVIK